MQKIEKLNSKKLMKVLKIKLSLMTNNEKIQMLKETQEHEKINFEIDKLIKETENKKDKNMDDFLKIMFLKIEAAKILENIQDKLNKI